MLVPTDTTMPTASHITALPKPDEQPDCFPKGRPCTEPGCITTLTIWNPGPYCYAHAAKHGVKLAAEEERQAERRAWVIGQANPNVQRAVRLRDEGHTYTEIAEQLGFSRQWAQQAVTSVKRKAEEVAA